MQAYHRRKALLDILVAQGTLAVAEVARRLGVSEVTIRSDLTALERQGKLRRIHGGAVLADLPYPRAGARGVTAPIGPHLPHLAQRAAAMVEDGESIVIVAGAGSADLARALLPRRHLKVVTNSLEVAELRETGHAASAVAVSQGADRLALEELARPGTPLVGTVAFRPESYGERLIPLALDVLAGREVPPAVYQQHWLIGPESVAQYLGPRNAGMPEVEGAGHLAAGSTVA